jgi:hypothetical protein
MTRALPSESVARSLVAGLVVLLAFAVGVVRGVVSR